MKLGLSIDLDYFQFEDPMWDWGHSENGLMNSFIWQVRYLTRDLFSECNVDRADVHPLQLTDKLKSSGYFFMPGAKVGCGWSHRFAYDFFKDADLDMVINLDAHHDFFKKNLKEIDCGNWAYQLNRKKGVAFTWVRPSWVEPTPDFVTDRGYEEIEFTDIGSCRGKIHAVYIAQSPSWVCPHNDVFFKTLVLDALNCCNSEALNFDYGFIEREAPTQEDIQTALSRQPHLREAFRRAA